MNNRNHTDDTIKEYYQTQNLSAEKLQQMIDIAQLPQQQSVSQERNIKQRWLIQRNLSVAASILLAVVISLQWLNPTPTQQQLVASIAQEIAINHQKQFDIEFAENSYASLNKLMGKLDFALISPEKLKTEGLQILGGRYCSLHGQIAAQIRLKNSEGVVFTLYQTRSDEKLKTLTEQSEHANGITIEMWQEDGVFLGVAG